MNIKPITTKRIYQEIIGSFVDFIANEEIKVGDKLPSERELSERFKVSRPSVREALRVMQTVGLIDIRAGGGAYMTDFNLGPFLDLFSPLFLKRKNFGLELLELRQILEVRAAELAAQNIKKKNIVVLEKILETMEKSATESDFEPGVESDIQFHKTIFDLTDNIILIRGLELVNSLMEISIKDARGLVLERAETPTQLYKEHLAIFKGILSQDQKKAADAMKKHLAVVRKVYTEYYKENA
jgi:GntR family transcriptional regulator, transcriptional repressor for pyruvate dehydrogenase complex